MSCAAATGVIESPGRTVDHLVATTSAKQTETFDGLPGVTAPGRHLPHILLIRVWGTGNSFEIQFHNMGIFIR
jgi:hypothetical protein